MVSTTLTTIVTTGTSNHHYQHQSPQQQSQPPSGRNYYFSAAGDPKTTSAAIVVNSTSSTSGGGQSSSASLTASTGNTQIATTYTSTSSTATNVNTSNNSTVSTSLSSSSTSSISLPKAFNNEPSSTGASQSGTAAAAAGPTIGLIAASPPSINDQISLLFPKCRPKSDFNLNSVTNSSSTNSKINGITTTSNGNNNKSSGESPASSSLSSESLSSVTPRISTNPFVTINSPQDRYPPYYYHSTIKESQSCYPDMPRKRNYHSSGGSSGIGGGGGGGGTSSSNQNPFIKENYWETRHNTTPASTVLNSPELTEKYEGSPRRIGQGSPDEDHVVMIQQNSKLRNISPPLYTARPGFPQRIISTPRESPPPIFDQKQSEDTSNDVSEIGTSSDLTTSEPPKSSTFDYLYEFSETRKVLEEFFKCPSNDDKPMENGSDVDSIDIHYEFRESLDKESSNYIGQRLATSPLQDFPQEIDNPCQNGYGSRHGTPNDKDNHDIDFFLDSASRSSGDAIDNQDGINQNRVQSRSFRYSPETTDYDSNCGDLDSLSGEFNGISTYPNYTKYYTASMPVLEDGLSSGHASDTENNNPPAMGISMLMDMRRTPEITEQHNIPSPTEVFYKTDSPIKSIKDESGRDSVRLKRDRDIVGQSPNSNSKVFKNIDPDLDSLYSISVFHRPDMIQLTPPPPAPAPHRKPSLVCTDQTDITSAALKDLRPTIQRTKTIPSIGTGPNGIGNAVANGTVAGNLNATVTSVTHEKSHHLMSSPPPPPPERMKTSPLLGSPVWIPRHMENSTTTSVSESEVPLKNLSGDEEDVDTDLETDRLLGHQRLDDQGFYDENKSWERKPRSLLASSLSKFSPKVQQTKSTGSSLLRQGLNSLLPTTPEVVPPPPPPAPTKNSTSKLLDIGGSMSSPDHSEKSPDKTLEVQNCNMESPSGSTKSKKDSDKKGKKSKNKEVLIEGVLFRARYLGSTQLVCEGQPTKSTRMMQAEEAVSRIKALAPDGEAQPSTEVDLFISTEKIMVLNTDLKEIMMDHALRTISYIADIGDLVVLMARRRFVPQDIDDAPKPNRTPKMICHVFESDEAQFIAQSIGQAFQVAYMEFLKANGIEDHSFVKEMDYQEVLNSQEIFGDELEIFAKKELQKEVVVPKAKGEILGVVIVESGWGSMLPTVVIANLMSSGAAARCGQLNIGDQLIAINGMSLVGLPLSTCQTYIKNTKNQTVVKFTVVPCAPVVEVKIKRPNTKYQLGFSVQNGVICSLLRGGIAERGGVRVGHRIIEINNQSVVAVPHEKIVNLLATSVGEILMKTMPTSMFRLLTGQENPIYI